jgi:hypothetical protein
LKGPTLRGFCNVYSRVGTGSHPNGGADGTMKLLRSRFMKLDGARAAIGFPVCVCPIPVTIAEDRTP